MKRMNLRSGRILFLLFILAGATPHAAGMENTGAAGTDALPKGPYFGQKPPGRTAERFAPGILSTAQFEHGTPVFVQGEFEFYLSRVVGPPWKFENLCYRMSPDGGWSREAVRFGDEFMHTEIQPSRDGRLLYYSSLRPRPGIAEEKTWHFWVMDRDGGAGADSRPLPPPLNSTRNDCQLFEAADGSFYFASWRNNGQPDLFRALVRNGVMILDTEFGPGINSEFEEKSPFVSDDGRMLLFQSNRPGGHGEADIYLCRRGTDGRWSAPVNAGPLVNSPSREWYPRLSPDGRHLFFLSDRTGDFDIYWIDAAVLEDPARPPAE
jgi:hypothetical protein